MRLVLQLTSYLALAVLFAASIAYLVGSIEKDLLKQSMLTGTIAWFFTAPLWIGRKT
ncbi:hypothetical protein VDG1235_296 [Verrucomicrobiia bacterium DG1235]|nr:hypothetical protein VDG1235_296 [Verrucomicrobiae bacterium DG1235]